MLTKKQMETIFGYAEELHGSSEQTEKNEFSERMKPILASPESKHFLIRLMDVAFRSKNYNRVSNYVLNLLQTDPSSKGLFNSFEQLLIALYKGIGRFFPNISIPVMLGQIKKVTSPILFYVGDQKFNRHAQKREAEGIELNVNLIGEALIGEEEAAERIEAYKSLLRQDDVNYISIKISTIYSQINSLAFEHTIDTLVEKLEEIYDELLTIHEKTGEWKFVNLDMEEYRDLDLTIITFIRTLSKEKYKNLRAGIVLQAYLPDVFTELQKLKSFADERVAAGGAPIKIRVVKGANLEMEKTESSLEDWPLAPYSTKVETDANYKKILMQLLQKESLKSIHLGIASHNIFDLAFGLQMVKEHGLEEEVDFEMLEGMANQTVDELLKQKVQVLLYTPIVKHEDYNSAIAYLVRRLDEGTQEGNFLKEGFELKVGSEKWEEIKQQFVASVEIMDEVSNAQHRTQNRSLEEPQIQQAFHNVPNTDWNLKVNRLWLEEEKQKWVLENKLALENIPVVGGLAHNERQAIKIENWQGESSWQYNLANEADYRAFLDLESDWYTLSHEARADLLKKAAVEIERNRGKLIAVAVDELGKTFAEVDVEVSEAIDFANFYAESAKTWASEVAVGQNSGTNLILSPWNFPIAIPIGGVLASLAAGKRAILKPSTNAAATAYLTSLCLWAAGIPKDAFAFLPCEEQSLDIFLAEGRVFDAVILTGGTETAKFLLKRNPDLQLYAETGGKNSTIVSALSDREQAIKNVVQSAFGNAGQKCSATSLLILEAEVFDDPHFKKLLKDAAESRHYGNPWLYQTQTGPLAVPISDKLKHVLENTKDEQWLVKPTLSGQFMLKPGIKWGITTADYEYNNELFGPIVAVMRADNLAHAVKLVNGVEYGLTSGLESLDRREIDYWKAHIKAGNLYVNRSTTGAIVLRQPFGGIKASSFGFGMKAGGHNYVAQFMQLESPDRSAEDIEKSYRKWAEILFLQEIDYVKLRGQHNITRYLRPEKVSVLLDKETNTKEIEMVALACEILHIPTEFYCVGEAPECPFPITELDNWNDLAKTLNFENRLRALNRERLPKEFVSLCHEKALHIYGQKPSVFGRFELLNYLNEQSFSHNYHRYGNLLGEKEPN
ncbi:bifunctional proline dehydrogenase/L-glutamate gamma-semialdehyde dehydrogenase [Marinilongibacter aquaticus]|uniref:bifunctional proline dehydrogenase/L-glutamate gamma-semialdehyde dehydrogenase n=1 Tax=Marinilongibacter aquaticus TaxID=2975157 RepID=UPI0021BD588C|nr:bifunctional proline dehydrogenase/L-glutamate gamma-semialdehyde dehydrogenase [Marinilongibacter aquaticus]UBM59807.1 bifunctional proline dehydrogenase/L-glutamate gamma-semialdehyde dehydrogenase [Marinilongibacter aquaticus]